MAASVHPLKGSNVIVEPSSVRPSGSNTYTGPRFERCPRVTVKMSVLVDVAITAPGASSRCPITRPVLPTRGPANVAVWSSALERTLTQPTVAIVVPSSVSGTKRRFHAGTSASDGRTCLAFLRRIRADDVRNTSRPDANPSVTRPARPSLRSRPRELDCDRNPHVTVTTSTAPARISGCHQRADTATESGRARSTSPPYTSHTVNATPEPSRALTATRP